MKLVMLTNMPSYHQMQLGQALALELGEDSFRLVFESPPSESRQEMGWSDSYSTNYLLRCWQDQPQRDQVAEWIEQADVVVVGRFFAFKRQINTRIKAGKLTFSYQERFWKRPKTLLRIIARLPRIYKRYWSMQHKNHHLLAAGAYVAPDLNSLHCFRQRSWKFGYFIEPSTLIKPDVDSHRVELLWCARFSPVKQPDIAISIVKRLKDSGVDCHLTMIGGGELRQQTEREVAELGLQAVVSFSGWQDAQAVSDSMLRADIFLMTSAFGEGWGLVVNEAISSGCVVLANRAVGSVPWLIQDGETGFSYQSQSELQAVLEKVRCLDKAALRKMGLAARQNINQNWSTTAAAQNLVKLSDALLNQQPPEINSGPCSRA